MHPLSFLVAASAASVLAGACDTSSAPLRQEAPTVNAGLLDEEAPEGLPLPTPNIAPSDVCGGGVDWVDVESFAGNSDFPADFIEDFAESTVLIEWLDNETIQTILTGEPRPARPVGYRRIKRRGWCTGTHLGGGRILTAAHCFDERHTGDLSGFVTPYRLDARNNKIYYDAYTNAQLMIVRFNHQVDAPPPGPQHAAYEIARLVEYSPPSTTRVDYAIIEIRERPTRVRGLPPNPPALTSLPFAVLSARNPQINTAAAIIQHPNGGQKSIHTGTIAGFSDNLILYANIDTRGGSSGAGLRNQAGEVQGVHIRGGCKRGVGNRAVGIEAIRGASPSL